MELEIVATISLDPVLLQKGALCKGAELIIPPTAPKTLSEALHRTADNYPHKTIRLCHRDGTESTLNYATLLNRATRVLSGLRSRGLAPGNRVLLQVDSLAEHFAAFWGCVLGGFIPVTVAIAPTYEERNGVVDKLCNTWQLLQEPPILTTRRLENALLGLPTLMLIGPMKTFVVEDLLESAPATSLHTADPEEIVFIQLSSGSTGVPKCIQQTHRAIIAHIHSSKAFNNYTSDDVTLNWLPMDHVVPLLTFHLRDTYLGCEQIHVPTELVISEPLLWLDLLEKHRVTHTWSPNFGFKLVSDRLSRGVDRRWDLRSIKFFMNAGEQVTLPVVRDFLRVVAPFGVRESAMQPAFGMAEVCTCMTYANQFSVNTGARRFLKASLNGELEPANPSDRDIAEFVSLGEVTPGISIRITDAENQLLPEAHIGRLQIKGPVVTPGYYQNNEANHEAFVDDDWFNTGDLGFIQDGELFITGREKEIIVIRGAKFYCYEIEDVINNMAGVEPTFVATCGTNNPHTGTETLAVFFSPTEAHEERSVAQTIQRTVTARLGITPEIVVPIPKHQFPKTTSGKIQRTQLKRNLESGVYRETRAALAKNPTTARVPGNEIDKAVMSIWQEVLGIPNVNLDAHLFESGGDSLKATQIASRIRDRWQIDFPVKLFFSGAGTIEGMAAWISENRDLVEPDSAPPSIQPVSRNTILPLSYSQLRLWLAEQISPGTSLYNIGRTYSIKGALEFPALERAIQRIVERHEILRTTYSSTDMPVQKIQPQIEIRILRHELAHLSATERARVVSNLLLLEIARPFDLETGPLLRAKLIRIGSDEHLLALTFHQIATDGWSLDLFARELSALYTAFVAGQPDPLPTITIQYADYAAWQQRWFGDSALEKQLAFWKNTLARGMSENAGQIVSLSVDSPPPGPVNVKPPSLASGIQRLDLDKPLFEKLRMFCVAESATSYMILLGVYQLLLRQWTGGPVVTIGSPESGRHRVETEKLLGCFVNLLPILMPTAPNDSFRRMLSQIREITGDAFANADVPFENIQALARPSDAGERERLFRFWLGPIDSLQPFTMGELRVEPRPLFPPDAQFDLSCFISERSDSLTCYFEYKRDVFTPKQMDHMTEQFRCLLEKLLENADAPIPFP